MAQRCSGNGFVIRERSASIWAVIAIMLLGTTAYSQTNRFILDGNKAYQQQNYKQASIDYAKALQKDPNNVPGIFNLGNSLYQQKQYDSSRRVMESAAKAAPTKEGKAQANYNIGNTYMSQKKWDEAIDAYKRTLRNNPQDADAKYNLSYANAMKKKEEQQQQQNKDKKDQQQQKDQQKQEDKKDDKKDKKDQDQGKDGDKKEEQKKDQQQPQPDPSKMSEQAAEQALNALRQKENEVQDKMKKEKGVPVHMQKDW